MKLNACILAFLSLMATSCNQKKSKQEPQAPKTDPQEKTTPSFQNKGQELVYKMVQKVGDIQALHKKKDVTYTYTYQTPDGKKDVSTEKYIFDGELSYGHYQTHERTFPDLEGSITQGYNGKTYWLTHNGKALKDSTLLKRVAFNRPTNYYWFTMMPKLLDPGLHYAYLGEKTLNNTPYDIVKVSFTSQNNSPTDIYQVYINKNTQLVDQFLFTVADFGVMDTPFLMTVTYEEVDGIWIPSKRRYKASTWDATVDDTPWTEVTWSQIKFNTGLTPQEFSIE